MVGLQDLPPELFLHIINEWPWETQHSALFNLSTLSRALHYKCLPILLRLRGVQMKDGEVLSVRLNYSNISYDIGSIDLVQCLHSALFISRLKCLEIDITAGYGYYKPLELEHVKQPLDRVRQLLMKLSSVDTLSLTVTVGKSLGADLASQVCCAIQEFLQVASAKTTQLILSGEIPGTVFFKAVSSRASSWSRSRIMHQIRLALDFVGRRKGMRGVDWEYHVLSKKIDQKPTIPSNHRTHTISFRSFPSTSFLEPPLLFWALDLLRLGRTPNLELLRIRTACFGGNWHRSTRWDGIISSITSVGRSCLTELVVDQCDIRPWQLYKLLSKLPNLSSVKVVDYPTEYYELAMPPKLHVPHLPQLRYFEGPGYLLAHFLSNGVLPPTVERICLVTPWYLPSNDLTILRELDDHIRNSESRCTISLSCRNDDPVPRGPSFAEHIAVAGSLPFLEEVSLLFRLSEELDQDWQRGLFSQAPAIKNWFGHFTDLTRVVVDVCTEGYYGHRIYKSIDGANGQLRTLGQEICEQNRKLVSVLFNGTEFVDIHSVEDMH